MTTVSPVENIGRTFKTYLRDTAERAARAFITGFGAVLLVAVPVTDWTSVDSLKALGVSALGGGLAAVMDFLASLAAQKRGSAKSASLSKQV